METLPDHLTQDFPPPPVPRESLDIDAPWAQLARPLDRASLLETRANIDAIRGFLAGMRLETITDANGTVWNVMARRAGQDTLSGNHPWRLVLNPAGTVSCLCGTVRAGPSLRDDVQIENSNLSFSVNAGDWMFLTLLAASINKGAVTSVDLRVASQWPGYPNLFHATDVGKDGRQIQWQRSILPLWRFVTTTTAGDRGEVMSIRDGLFAEKVVAPANFQIVQWLYQDDLGRVVSAMTFTPDSVRCIPGI